MTKKTQNLMTNTTRSKKNVEKSATKNNIQCINTLEYDDGCNLVNAVNNKEMTI